MNDSFDFEAARATIFDAQMARWRRFAGELLPEMLKSEEAALRFLRHESAEVRTAGIQVLKNHWRVRDVGSFSDTCEALIVRDTDPGVRHAAALSLGQCYEFSDNVRVSVLLAQVVRNGSELDEVRRAAYFALIRVRRSGTRLHPTAAAKLKDLRTEIDWRFVEESLDRWRSAVPIDRFTAQFQGRVSEEHLAEFRLYREGIEALGRGDAEAALTRFSEILEREPNAGGIFATRAKAFVALGRADEAIADLSRAIELRSDSAMLLRERAKAYRLKGAIDLAEQDEQAAAAIEGDANQKRYEDGRTLPKRLPAQFDKKNVKASGVLILTGNKGTRPLNDFPVDQFKYGYDQAGNVLYKLNDLADTLANPSDGTVTPYLDELYSYNNLGELTGMQRGEIAPGSITAGAPSMECTNLKRTWGLDGMGNWSSYTSAPSTTGGTGSSATEARAVNKANQIVSSNNGVTTSGIVTPVYDSDGNMTIMPAPSAPDSTTAEMGAKYDAWGRLVEVDNSSADPIAMYQYDGEGRLIEEATNFTGGRAWQDATTVTHYYYAAGQVVETRQAVGSSAASTKPETLTPQNQYVWSAQSDAPILRDTCDANGAVIPDGRIYYTTDAEGNVTAITNYDGSTVLERYVYDPYGNVTSYNATWSGSPSEDTGSAFLYGGMMYDSVTGLYYARARWYNPAVGQFTSQDPTGFAAGDANLYRYVGDNPATMTDPWGLSGGGGGNGTWDPGNVSPLMPMVAPDTPCDGPMVTEMGLNVPSPLMPMIAPDTPFEGPMVNYLDAYGSPWMPMHSPDEPFEGPMVNYLDAYGAPWMPMHSPDEPYEGQFVNYLGAKQRVQVDPSSVKFRVVEVHAEVTTGDGSKIMVKSPFRAILDYVKDGSWDVIKKCGQEWRSWLAGKWSVTRIAQELRDEVKSGIDSCLAALKLGLTEAETKMFVTDVQVTATVEVTYRVKVLNEDGTGEWETRTQTVPVVLAMKNSLLINILSKAGVDELIGVVQRLGRDAIGKLDGVDAMAGAAFWAWLYGEYNVFKW